MLGGGRARRLAAVVVAGLVCAMALVGAAHAQTTDDAAALNAEVVRLYQAGKYAEATEIAKRVLAIREKALGPEHPDVGTVAQQPGRAVPGPGPLRRGRAALPAQPRHPREGAGARAPRRRHRLNNLAGLYQAQGRYAEAEPLYRRSLAIREKALGPEHPDVGAALNNLAVLYRAQGRYAEAEPLYQAQPRHPREGAGARASRRRHVAQQPGRAVPGPGPLRRGRAALPAQPRHPREGAGARAPRRGHRRSTTWPSCTRPRAATPRPSRSSGAASPSARRRWGRAPRRRHRRSTTWPSCTGPRAATPRPSRSTGAASPSARRRWGPSTPTSAPSLNNLAELYRAQGRYAEAEPLYRRSLAIREKALGPEHPDVGTGAQQPGRAVPGPGPLRRGRAALPAQPRHPREGAGARASRRRHRRSTTWPGCTGPRAATPRPSRSIGAASPSARRRWGPSTPTWAPSLNNLAWLALAQGDWAQAADYWRRSTGVIQRRARARARRRRGGFIQGRGAAIGWQFAGLVKMTHRLATQGRVELEAQARAMFETAQWAQGSEAAASLAQMAARSAKGSPQLGRPGARAAGPGERMAGQGQAAHRRQERGAGEAQCRRREGA